MNLDKLDSADILEIDIGEGWALTFRILLGIVVCELKSEDEYMRFQLEPQQAAAIVYWLGNRQSELLTEDQLRMLAATRPEDYDAQPN